MELFAKIANDKHLSIFENGSVLGLLMGLEHAFVTLY